MRVIITGGTGLIGAKLAESLLGDGHEVIVLSRSPNVKRSQTPPAVGMVEWDARTADGWGELADGAYAIVNLAGKNLATWPWTAANKLAFYESRLHAGQAVTAAVEQAQVKPQVVIQASSTGYYAERGDKPVVETDPPGTDFLSRLVQDWEQSTQPVEAMGVRRVIIRTGLPLSTAGGIFPKLVLPVRLFAGGPLGSGRQYYPWLHIDDEVRAIRFLLEDSAASGPYNLSAPNPLPQKELTRQIAAVLNRPALLPVPAFALRLVLGEMANVVLANYRLLPERLQAAGFEFKYPILEPALRDLLK